MLSHHKLIAGQRIEGSSQLRGLRDPEITGIGHAMNLSLQ